MKPKFLALLLLAAVIALGVFQLIGGAGAPTDSGAGIDGDVARDGATEAAASGSTADLKGVEGQKTSRGTVAPASTSLADDPAAETVEAGHRALRVEIEWPAGSQPSPDVVVYALGRSTSGVNLQSAVRIDDRTRDRRRSARSIQAVLGDVEGSSESVLTRVVAERAVTLREGRTAVATLSIPERRGRVFLHALGGGFATDRQTEARVNEAGTITLRPLAKSALTVTVEGTEASPIVKDALLRLRIDPSLAAQVASSESGLAGFDAAALLDESGTARLLDVPAGLKLELRINHEALAPVTMLIDPLQPTEQRTINVPLDDGATLTGRALDSDGKTIEAASVDAYLPGQAFGFDDDPVRNVLTDTRGNYSISGMPEGKVILRASKEGLFQSGRIVVEAPPSGASKSAPDLVLETGKSIAGKVVDASGKPVANAALHAKFDVAHLGGMGALGATRGYENRARSNEDGTFAITGLGAGPFSVKASGGPDNGWSARADGVKAGDKDLTLELRTPSELTGLVIDDAGAVVPAEQVVCRRVVDGAMGDVRVDRKTALTDSEGRFRLEDLNFGTWEITVLGDHYVTSEALVVVVDAQSIDCRVEVLRAATITGVILDPDGAPLPSVRVAQRFAERGLSEALAGREKPERTKSENDGKFVLMGVIPGEVVLSATSDNFAPVESDVLVVSPGEVLDEITLRLERGGTIEGVCFDKDGKTEENKPVIVQSMALQVTRQTLTGAGGMFTESGLPPGQYQVIAMARDMDLSGDMEAAGTAALMTSMDMAMVTVVEGETELIFLGAPPAAPVDVTGKVTMGGEPLAGAIVSWLPANTVGMYDKMRIASTEEDGSYSLTLDDAGEYVIQVSKVKGSVTGEQQSTEFRALVAVDTKEFTRDLELPGGSIAGLVKRSDGTPAGSVRISAMQLRGVATDKIIGGSFVEAKTNDDGTFLLTGLSPGTYQVTAGGAAPMSDSDPKDARTMSDPIEVGKDSAVTDVEIEVGAPGRVRVTIVDSAGDPAVSTMVFLRDDKGRHTELLSMSATNANGEVTLRGVAPGRYTACGRGPETSTEESAFFSVKAGETAEIGLTMGEAGIIVANVIGEADGGSRVTVLDSMGLDVTRRMGLFDAQSQFANAEFSMNGRRVGPLPPGRYTVIAEAPDGRKAQKRIGVRSGSERKVNLVLK